MHVCCYLGSSFGNDPAYREAAAALGDALARGGHVLVYGGAGRGLMGVLADAALAAGGRVIGVIPRFLADAEIAHRGLSELHVVDSLHERKLAMATRADGFVALPGGMGTFEELCETITWAQLGLHAKPIVVLDTLGFFAPFLALFEGLIARGFVRPEQRALVGSAPDAAGVLAALRDFTPLPPVAKWVPRP